MTTSIEKSRRSFAAYKGHFNRTAQAFDAVLKIKPNPTIETLEKSYARVQKQLDALLNSADQLTSLMETSDSADSEATRTELGEIATFYDKLLRDQCVIESKYVEFKQGYATSTSIKSSTPVIPTTIETTRPSVRLTALAPPSWNGIRADFYT